MTTLLALDECGLNPADLTEPDFGSDAPETPLLGLQSEDDPKGKAFPWRQVMAIFKRIVPQVVMPCTGQRRDLLMKKFWRDHGKAIGAFELLAEQVAESDYLMARNGHTGNDGRPYSWGWIFSKTAKGELRAEKVLLGEYSTERMAFVLQRGAQKKLTKVMTVGSSTAIEADLTEQWNGRPRFRSAGTHTNGLPLVLDLKD